MFHSHRLVGVSNKKALISNEDNLVNLWTENSLFCSNWFFWFGLAHSNNWPCGSSNQIRYLHELNDLYFDADVSFFFVTRIQ